MNEDEVSEYWFGQRAMAYALALAEERVWEAELAVQSGKLGNTRVHPTKPPRRG